MSRKIFISYRFHNNEVAHAVKNFFQPNGGTCHGEPVFVTRNLSREGEDAIIEEIRAVMRPCMAMLVVVGDDSHNSPWMERELKIAVSRSLPILAVQLPETYGAPPNHVKEILKKNPIKTVEWRQNSLCPALNAIPTPTTSG